MVRLEYKHFEKEFRTKFKLFTFFPIERGNVVRIIEWRKTTSFSINLDLGGAAWISDVVNNVLRQEPMEEFKRFYRAHNYSVHIDFKK